MVMENGRGCPNSELTPSCGRRALTILSVLRQGWCTMQHTLQCKYLFGSVPGPRTRCLITMSPGERPSAQDIGTYFFPRRFSDKRFCASASEIKTPPPQRGLSKGDPTSGFGPLIRRGGGSCGKIIYDHQPREGKSLRHF